jgi:hypothetical protein
MSKFSYGQCPWCKRGISDNEEGEFNGVMCYPCSLMFNNYKEGKCLFCHGDEPLIINVNRFANGIKRFDNDSEYKNYLVCYQCAVNKLNLNEDRVLNLMKEHNSRKLKEIVDKFDITD